MPLIWHMQLFRAPWQITPPEQQMSQDIMPGFRQLQEGVSHFLLPDVGFIAYTKMKQPALADVLVLGDPICNTSRYVDIAMANCVLSNNF
jgi:hypothetical protein